MCYPGMVHIKEPMLLIGKSSGRLNDHEYIKSVIMLQVGTRNQFK